MIVDVHPEAIDVLDARWTESESLCAAWSRSETIIFEQYPSTARDDPSSLFEGSRIKHT